VGGACRRGGGGGGAGEPPDLGGARGGGGVGAAGRRELREASLSLAICLCSNAFVSAQSVKPVRYTPELIYCLIKMGIKNQLDFRLMRY
jgi:hypothetical protein